MTRRAQRVLATTAIVLLGGAGLAASASFADGHQGDGSSVRIGAALRVEGRCEKLGRQLPVLVAVDDFEPGQSTRPVGVCVSNLGTIDAKLFLSVVDGEAVEVGCTGDEATVDATCGAGPGELGDALAVAVAVQEGCRGSFGPVTTVRFADLARHPLALPGPGLPGRMDCLSMSLRYDPVSLVSAVASQTDVVSWRYAFDLVG